MHKVTCLYTLVFISAMGKADDQVLEHLMSLSLEELSMLNVEMETATKSTQRLADIPSSVYVLSNERIVRSGARSIPEALSLVPGLHVSKFSDAEWIMSARGFHDGLFNKLLVLLDGRTLYSPLYGGVYWADIDYVLEDIERIEVLRGPGAALWGGNAVNGVINIITKSAKDTKGTHVAGTWAQGGDYDASIRHGIELNDTVDARAFYKRRQLRHDRDKSYPDWTLQTAGFVTESNDDNDKWSFRLGGERLTYTHDWWQLHYRDGYLNDVDEIKQRVESYSFYSQLNYQTQLSEKHSGRYQVWVDRNSSDMPDDDGLTNTFDLDITHSYNLDENHLITYGGGYRLVEAKFFHSIDDLDFNNIPHYQRYAEDQRDVDSTVNLYIQSDKSWQNGFKSVFGLKGEYFEHTNESKLSPQVRGLYAIDNEQTVWLGYGEASVAPSYADTNSYLAVNLYYPQIDRHFTEVHLPDDNFRPESVTTYEAGYRYQGDNGFEFDSTLFISNHQYVRGKDTVYLRGVPEHVYGVSLTDDYELHTQGVELSMGYTVSCDLRFYASYSYLQAEGKWKGGTESTGNFRKWYAIDGQHTASLQSLWNITPQWQLDFVARAHTIQYGDGYTRVPGYLALDGRLAWQLHANAPKVEFLLHNIGEKQGYRTDWISKANEQSGAIRASYEF